MSRFHGLHEMRSVCAKQKTKYTNVYKIKIKGKIFEKKYLHVETIRRRFPIVGIGMGRGNVMCIGYIDNILRYSYDNNV